MYLKKARQFIDHKKKLQRRSRIDYIRKNRTFFKKYNFDLKTRDNLWITIQICFAIIDF